MVGPASFPRQDLCRARQLNDRTKKVEDRKTEKVQITGICTKPQAIQGVTPPCAAWRPIMRIAPVVSKQSRLNSAADWAGALREASSWSGLWAAVGSMRVPN